MRAPTLGTVYDRTTTAASILFLTGMLLWEWSTFENSGFHSMLAAVLATFQAHLVDPLTVTLAVVLAIAAGTLLTDVVTQTPTLFKRLFEKPVHGQRSLWQRIGGRLAAERAWAKAAAAWKAQAPPPDVSDLKPPIETLKQQLDALIADREARIRACAAPEPEDAQCARYLGAFRIEDAKLQNIGPARCAVLRSWGFDTAADVDEAKIAEIPGFGKNLTDKLVIWRELKEKAFAPNAVSIVDPLEVQHIDRQLAASRTKLMKELREKVGLVEQRMGGYITERAALWAQVGAAFAGRFNGAPP